MPQLWETINETDKGEEFQAAPVISKVRKFAEARVCVSSVEQRRRLLTLSGKELHPDVSATCTSIAICSLVPAMKGLLSMRLRFFPGDYSYFSAEAGVYAIGIFFSEVIRHECVACSRTSIYLLRASPCPQNNKRKKERKERRHKKEGA